MYPVCSFCGERPVVAWFEGPHFRNVVDLADEVGAEEAWLACEACLVLVNADDREGLVDRGMDRQRWKDRERDRERGVGEVDMLRRAKRRRLEDLFWRPRSS